MKRFIIYNICIAVLLSFVSCSQDPLELEEVGAPIDLLTLSVDKLETTAERKTFDVVATSRYMPVCKIEYAEPNSADGWVTCTVGDKSVLDTPLQIVVAENKSFEDRSATISVVIRDDEYGVEYAKTISVTQSAAVPRAENGEYKISADSYNLSFTIKTNLLSYKIKSSSSWLTLNKTTGSGNTSIMATATTNPETKSRSATISIESTEEIDGKKVTFQVAKITQEAMTYIWSATYEGKEESDNQVEISAPWYAKEYTVQISTNLSWKVSGYQSPAWYTVETKSKDVTMQTTPTKTEFKFNLQENRTEKNREVTFTIYSSKNSNYSTKVTVNQEFAPSLSVNDGEELEPLNFKENSYSVKVNTTANTKWSAESDSDWLTIDTQKGEGEGDLNFSVSNNDTTSSRTATITVSLDDYPGVEVLYEVTQKCYNTIRYTAESQLDIPEDEQYWGDRVVSHVYNESTKEGYIEFAEAPTKVGDSVFKDCGDLVGIKLPKSITSIEGYAFYSCSNLESVEISEGFTSIGYRAFEECEKLKNITIPSSVSSIGDRAFYHCANLESINIPEGITSIGSAMFAHCTSFTTITIPDSVTSINENAFNGCTGLTSLTIGQGVESIDAQTFLNCPGLTSITIPESVTSIGARAFGYFTGELIVNSKIVETDYTEENRRGSNNHWLDLCGFTKVTFGHNITKIGDNAFHSCTTLKNVTIPSGVISIGDYAFANCKGLEKINVPNSVTSIGKYAFEECTGRLEMNSREIIETDYNTNEYDDYIAENTYNNYWIRKSRFVEIVLGSHITKIGERAFYKCDGIGRVLFGTPYSITSIGSYSFYGCSGINYMYIPSSVESIGRNAFYNCTGDLSVDCNIPACEDSANGAFRYSQFGSVIIGDGVTEIGDYAFCNSSELTTITIGKNVASIGQSAFTNCSALTRVNISDMTAWLKIDFANSSANPLVSAKNLYLNGGLVESLTIPSEITEIKPNSFLRVSSLKRVELHNRITKIGSRAFYACESLTSITIPNSVTSIGEYAFYKCNGLTSINIPEGVTSIESSTFYSCENLTSVTLPASVTYIGDSAFYVCRKLTSVNIPEGVTYIGTQAFLYCHLESITIPASVTFIGGQALMTSYLNNIYCKPTTPPEAGGIMYYKNAKVYVPMASVEAYKSAEYWSDYKDNIVGYNF